MIELAVSARGFSTDSLPKAAAMAKQAGVSLLEIPIASPPNQTAKKALMEGGT